MSRNHAAKAARGIALCAAIAVGAAAAASPEKDFGPRQVYVAERADVVASGSVCGIGAPLAPAFVLSIGPVDETPDAVGVFRDDAGVAMPMVPRADGAFALIDSTKPADAPGRVLGIIAVIQREPSPWIAIDYERWDLRCRLSGTVAFTPVEDDVLAANVAQLTHAFARLGRLNALRASGDSRGALAVAAEVEASFRASVGAQHKLSVSAGMFAALLHNDLDEYPRALELNERAIPRLADAIGPDHWHVWRARSNQALYLVRADQLEEAEALYRTIAQRYETLLDANDRSRLMMMLGFGELLHIRGSLAESERILTDVVVRFERTLGPDDKTTVNALNHLAGVFLVSGRLDDALAMYATVIERYTRSLGPRDPYTLDARDTQLLVLNRMGRRAEAQAVARELLTLRREVHGPRDPATLMSQQLLATLLLSNEETQDEVAEALALQREVVEARGAGPSRDWDVLFSRAMLGRVEASAGIHASAAEKIAGARSAAIQMWGPTNENALMLSRDLGYAQRRAGDLTGARETFRQTVASIEAWRETGATILAGRRDLFAPWVPLYKNLVAIELALGNVADAFEQSERSKARVLIELLALRRGEARDVLPAEAITMLSQLDRRLAELEVEIARAPRDPSVRLPLEQRRASVAEEARALRRDLRERHPKYSALSEARVLGASEAAPELPASSAFVSYVRVRDRVIAFTLDRSGRLTGRDLGDIPGLDDTVVAYRALLAGPKPGSSAPIVWKLVDGRYRVALTAGPGAVRITDAKIIGAELARRLLEPLPELMRARRWIISPDSALALVPFETLPHRGRPLVLTREISYSPSLTVYALTARRGRDYDRLAGRSPLYAMGAALYRTPSRSAPAKAGNVQLATLAGALAFDREGVRRAYDALGATWPDLPNSAAEIRQVEAHFRNAGAVTVRSFGEATEARLLEDDRRGMLGRHRYVLLSAHGFLSTEAPSLSAVVLGQIDVTPEADGYVTAAEWTSYTLRSDLIVISACETGVGQVIEGEGVAGLPYALFVAGNRNALLTLWPVADQSTAQFVSRFFGHLRAGLSQSDALTRTKREFAAKGAYTAPLHWAPFVLWGA